MSKFRKNSTSDELTIELIENNQIINELTYHLKSDSLLARYVPFDVIASYEIIPYRIPKKSRKSLVLGINYFHSSEMLDQIGCERTVHNEEELNLLIEDRIKDLKYTINETNPELLNNYTELGIKKEAYAYYKTKNRFKRK